jgi:hypothetical protein
MMFYLSYPARLSLIVLSPCPDVHQGLLSKMRREGWATEHIIDFRPPEIAHNILDNLFIIKDRMFIYIYPGWAGGFINDD